MYLIYQHPGGKQRKNLTIMIILITELFMFLMFTCASCLEQKVSSGDYSALMAFKSHLIFGKDNVLLSNWSSESHFCNWFGVSCLDQRVIALQLPGLALHGAISPEIANLTQLVELDLSNNELGGTLPSELGFLQNLKVFNVSGNSIHGSIPGNLSRCWSLEELYISTKWITGRIPEELGLLSNLKALRLNDNNLTGRIPASLGNLSKLEYFYLHENEFNGEIPASIGDLTSLTLLSFRGNNFTGSIPHSIFNMSSLQIVDMSINGLSGTFPEDMGSHLPNLEKLFVDSNRITGNIPPFLSNATKLVNLFFTENDLQGNIPSEYGKLLNLEWFEFEYNRVSGNFPSSVFNISSLQILKARHNYLSGHVPPDLGTWLPNLQEIFLSHNQFSGEMPSTICNASKLVYLEIANNSFSGPLPRMLGNLVDLKNLNLQHNMLVNEPQSTYIDFLSSLVNCRDLEYLIIESNPLNGILPESVGNLSSNLKVIAAASCKIKGVIPQGLGNLSSLTYLGLANNGLEGNIPSSFVRLQNLERLYLTQNKLIGTVTTELCSLTRLGILHLGENNLSGSIPHFINNLSNLVELSLAANNFHSVIPSSIWGLVRLQGLNLSRNQLHGFLAAEVGNLKAMNIMDLSLNNFSGEIPNSLGNLQYFDSLYMNRNSFEGSIPSTFASLVVLVFLDLSSNALSGAIPVSLESLRDLKYLNISFNRLQGKIPEKGVFANLSYESFMGNPKLCGAPKLKFPCSAQEAPAPRRSKFLILKITIPIVAIILVFVICLLLWISSWRKNHVQSNIGADSSPRRHQFITHYELVRATENFNESNLVGRGSAGMVFKGTLSDGTVAAIKVFNMQREETLKNFDAECEVLRNVRHRNLVRVISTCSNMDFRAMALEFMPNGSLDEWLHSHKSYLSLVQRLDILIDTAQAMEYLHHDYAVPIVHCDLKPSNVLLDGGMTAHVADFGIAKILAQDQPVALTRTLGTIGYIAPEYGIDGLVSSMGDVYSFGILLLETFTRKKPTDSMFSGDLGLHQWATRSFPDAVMEVLDPDLHNEVYYVREGNTTSLNRKQGQIEEILVSIFHVALLCLKESPEDRISMRDVVVQLKKIKNKLRDTSSSSVIVDNSEKPLLIKQMFAQLE